MVFPKVYIRESMSRDMSKGVCFGGMSKGSYRYIQVSKYKRYAQEYTSKGDVQGSMSIGVCQRVMSKWDKTKEACQLV